MNDRRRRSAVTGVLWALMSTGLLSCSASSGDPTPAAADDVRTPSAADVEPPAQPSTTAASDRIFIERASSPENAIAEIVGTGGVPSDVVTVDGIDVEVESFEADGDAFVARVRIEQEGAHTVCVADGCARVYTQSPNADTATEVAAKIDEALPLAAAIFDGEQRFAGWSVVRAGPRAGTGGSTDTSARHIVIYENRNRTVDDYVTTILHEWGHVVDHELLDDDMRATFRSLRGFPADASWDEIESHAIEDWAASPSEDFAETMVAWWTNTAHTVRTAAHAGQPDADTLSFVGSVLEPT